MGHGTRAGIRRLDGRSDADAAGRAAQVPGDGGCLPVLVRSHTSILAGNAAEGGNKVHEKVLPHGSVRLLDQLGTSGADALQGWTLAGGTGLALHFGHRISEDFDFFRTDLMHVGALHDLFRDLGAYETLQEAEHTLTVLHGQVKLSFFRIRDPFIFPQTPYRFFALAHVTDIALMKLVAISGRGSRKDFIDLYRILMSDVALPELFELLPRKYQAGRANAYHILKSLTYFADAETEPMPRMLEPFDWEECKAFFVREAHAIALG
jgi:hypothetical protein